MSEQGIIQGFQARRQLEDAIAALGRTTSEAELIAQAGEIANHFPAGMLATAVQRHLGDASSQLRGGLGHVCALLPTEVIAPVLRDVAGNRTKTPIERMSAVLILERYLGETVPQALTSDLAGNDDIALQSLLEAVEEGRSNRHVLLEYTTQMQEHGVDVAFMVLGLLNKLNLDERVQPLRLIAQDTRLQVARAALDRLTQLAAEGSADALGALHSLSFALTPALAEQVQRNLRKLQFTGHRHIPPAADRWRALINHTDAGGYFSMWLVRMPSDPARADGVLLGFVLALHQGVVNCSGVESMEAGQLPTLRAVGELSAIDGPYPHDSVMLELPFDAGRWLLQQALAAHWKQSEPADLPGEYKLYNDLVWQFAAPRLPDEYAHIFDDGVDTGLEQPDIAALIHAADTLVYHPVMRSWIAWAASIWTMLGMEQTVEAGSRVELLIEHILREIDSMPQRSQFLESMATALRVQALWLDVHGEADHAKLALLLARWMRSLPMRQNPLLATLLRAGLARKNQTASG